MTNSIFSKAGSVASSIGGGQHIYNKVVQPASYWGKDITAQTLGCGVDLRKVEFQAIGDSNTNTTTSLDVFVFPLPVFCNDHELQDCDLAMIGIGMTKHDEQGKPYWDLCNDEGYIHLSGWYSGYHTSIDIIFSEASTTIPHGWVPPSERDGRTFQTLFGNCDPDSRPVQISGKVDFQCLADTTSTNAEYVPVPYPLVSFLVFLLCILCTIRIRCDSLLVIGDEEYVQAPRTEYS